MTLISSSVRLCLTADLSDQEVTTLVSTLHAVGVEMGLIKSLNKQQSSVQLLLLKPFSEDSSVGGSITSNTNDSPELLAPATLVKIEDLITKVIEYSHQSYPKNDYFGLSRSSPRTIQATLEAFDSLHLGSCGPAIFYGTFKTHVQLQERIAALFGTESASVFSSSFNGTVSIVGAAAQRLLFGQRHVILCDEMVNRQIRLGLDKRSRKVELVFFKHNDVADFEAQLAKIVKGPSKGGKGVFITVCLEAVFRRTGTIPPLDRYNALLVGKSNDDNGGGTNNKKNKNQKKIEFRYLVNEEQSLGMLKHTSSGTNIKNWSLLSHHGIEISNSKISNHIFYGSLSHALCSQGGWVTGSYKDIVTLCSTNVAYFFSANSPPVSATVALENLNRLVDDHEVLQQQLQARVEVIQQNLDTGLSCCSPVCVIRLKEEKGVEGEKQGIKSLMDSIIDKWGRLIQMERGEDEVEGRDLRIFLSASIPLNTLQAFAEEMKQWCIMKKQ